MVLDAHGAEHPRIADQLLELRAEIRTVQTGRDEDDDTGRGYAGLEQLADDGLQEERVRDRTGDVANEDAGALLPSRALGEPGSPRGPRERAANGFRRIREQGHRLLPDDSDFQGGGQLDPQRSASVTELDFHRGPF